MFYLANFKYRMIHCVFYEHKCEDQETLALVLFCTLLL